MDHVYVYERFKEVFPESVFLINEWFPNGKDSIRLRYATDGAEVIFTYSGRGLWTLESIDHYIRKMRGGSVLNC